MDTILDILTNECQQNCMNFDNIFVEAIRQFLLKTLHFISKYLCHTKIENAQKPRKMVAKIVNATQLFFQILCIFLAEEI